MRGLENETHYNFGKDSGVFALRKRMEKARNCHTNRKMTLRTFSQVVSAAVADLEIHGFDSADRLARWQREIDIAAQREAKSDAWIDERLKDHLTRIYASKIERGGILANHPIKMFKLEQIKPKLRKELDRRIIASAQLIKLNREEMILRTLRRFNGWATSLPTGGSEAIDKREVAGEIKKGLKQLPFEERRVMIDQAAKFKASLEAIVAQDGGAIAAEWESRHSAGYDNRKEHLARDKHIYLIRDSWALKDGLIKLAGHQYTDEIDQPAELPYCSCEWVYLYNLRDMPSECITEKGRAAMAK
jgi:hypothetical protein